MGEGEANQDYNQSTPFHPLLRVCLHRPHRPLTATIAVNCLIDYSFTSLLPLLSSCSVSIIGVNTSIALSYTFPDTASLVPSSRFFNS